MAKEDRIKRLVPLFENGRIYLPERGIIRTDYQNRAVNIIRQFISEEYLAFPVGAHDDALDCMARILDEDLHAGAPDAQKPGGEPDWKSEIFDEVQRDFMVL